MLPLFPACLHKPIRNIVMNTTERVGWIPRIFLCSTILTIKTINVTLFLNFYILLALNEFCCNPVLPHELCSAHVCVVAEGVLSNKGQLVEVGPHR